MSSTFATARAFQAARPGRSGPARQQGAVLIVGLVMLAVMTLLVVSMIKTSVVELKIGGATQIAQQNMTNAERMINTFIDVNNGRFAANYLPLPTASGNERLRHLGRRSGQGHRRRQNAACPRLAGRIAAKPGPGRCPTPG